jgi:hypothetical protein
MLMRWCEQQSVCIKIASGTGGREDLKQDRRGGRGPKAGGWKAAEIRRD